MGVDEFPQLPKEDVSSSPPQSVEAFMKNPPAIPVDVSDREFRFELLNIAAVGEIVRAILKDSEFKKNIVVEKGTKFSGYEVIDLDSKKKVVRIQGPDGVITDLTRKPSLQSQSK